MGPCRLPRLSPSREYVPIRENKYISTAAPRSLAPPVFAGVAVGIRSRVAAGTMLPIRHWVLLAGRRRSSRQQAARDAEMIWNRAGNPDVRHPVDVVRTIDGDTFEARVHLWPGLDMTTRVRLRGIDAPE